MSESTNNVLNATPTKKLCRGGSFKWLRTTNQGNLCKIFTTVFGTLFAKYIDVRI